MTTTKYYNLYTVIFTEESGRKIEVTVRDREVSSKPKAVAHAFTKLRGWREAEDVVGIEIIEDASNHVFRHGGEYPSQPINDGHNPRICDVCKKVKPAHKFYAKDTTCEDCAEATGDSK